MKTEPTWCDECKLRTYDCEHKRPALAAPAPAPTDDEIEALEAATRARIRVLADSLAAGRARPARLELGFMSFCHLAVAPGARQVLVVQPQTAFKATRLIVDPVCAPHFRIGDIRIGNYSQWVAPPDGGGVGASCFPPDPRELETFPTQGGPYRSVQQISDPKFKELYRELVENLRGLPTCQLGQVFALEITNIDFNFGPHDFNALVYGEAVVG